MNISLRGWLLLGTFAALIAGLVVFGPTRSHADDKPAASPGQLSQESLGKLLEAIGLKPKLAEKRYDFAFRSKLDNNDWELSMSAVLSQNGESVWIMAWLDELPKSAADVPRTALLRLLADNDRLGNGKFFAYVAGNRRFVLQRVLPNQNISSAEFRAALLDLGETVVHTHPHWAVANWAPGESDDSTGGSGPAPAADATRQIQPASGSKSPSSTRK